MKRLFSITFKIAGVLVLLLLALAVFLQTGTGKDVLASTVSRIASYPENLEVRVSGVSGWVPFDMRVKRIEVGDARDSWLILRNVRVCSIVRDLFRGRVRLRDFRAGEVAWIRFPMEGNGSPAERKGMGWLERAEIVVERGSIGRLIIGREVAGTPLEFKLHTEDLVLFNGKVTGTVAVAGDADGNLEFDATIADVENLRAKVRLEVAQLNTPMFGLESFSGALGASMDVHGVEICGDVELSAAGLAGHASGQLLYSDRRVRLQDFCFASDDFELTGNAVLALAASRIDVDVDALLTDAEKRQYTLQGAAQVGVSNQTWSADISSLNIVAWDAVRVSVSGRLSPHAVELVADLAEFDLGSLPCSTASNLAGQVNGVVSVTGSAESPEVKVALNVVHFSAAADTLDELPKLDFKVVAGVSDGELSVSTSLTNCSSGYLVEDAVMPCTFSVAPFAFAVDVEKVTGSLDAIIDLGVLNGLAMMGNQHVSGFLRAELNVSDGIPSGFVYLDDGAYEHYGWGILFKDFQASLEAVPGGFAIRHAMASDGGEGVLSLSGGLQGGMFDISLNLSKALVIRRPEIEGRFSGPLKLSGPYARPSVKGTLLVDRLDLLPGNIVPGKPPVLESYDAEVQREAVAQDEHGEPLPVGLDVKLDMPDQVYITASLIDSVWGGTLRFRDCPDGLWIKGSIEPRRGYVDFLGKRFLLQHGSVDLDSAVQKDLIMNNLMAEYSRSDITARLVLNGSFANPVFRLESSPALPEDEILSQVLFRRDVSSITPYQAVQLAWAAKQLSGGVDGPGFLYQFRQAVGVDVLELREGDTEEDASSVAAGKYISPKLYIEVSSTISGETQTDMTAEYEIDRHFSIETSAGPELRPGIGLYWRYDY